MKMVKKVLMGLAVAAAVLTLVGCGDMAGAGSATGTKNNITYKVDATENASKKLDENATWRRYVKQIGNKEEVAEIKTTITIYKEFAKKDAAIFENSENKKAVIGFIVDYNNNADGTTKDFVVFGYRPANNTIYLGPYSAIAIGKNVELDTDNASLVDTTASPNAKAGNEYYPDGAAPAGSINTDADGNTVLEVEVKQETKGTYKFYLGGKYLGSWQGKTIDTKDKSKTKDYAIGGVAGYINCPKDGKVKVNYKTNSKDVTGSLFADEDEF